tara:strand:- start:882 stop:1187 length:306 start_codon:yes stop_codon:yes gene_type:complete
MKLFQENIILTKNYYRYGGDSFSTLGLVVDHRGIAYLYSNADNDMRVGRLFSITAQPEYIDWLIDNSMDLLELAKDPYADFYNDRTNGSRQEEFSVLLEKL